MSLGTEATPDQLRTWRGHPLVAAGLRWAVFSVPIAMSFAAAATTAMLVPRHSGWVAGTAWWLTVLAVSTATLVVTDRLARRVLPLAALMKLSLVFPDRAPKRFSFALRRGTTHQLQRRIAQAKIDGPAAIAAGDLLALAAALNAHDPRTRGHSERVRALSDLLAKQLGLGKQDRDRLHWAALLHDIGKLAVPAIILNKPGKPTDPEWERIKTHPGEGITLIHGPIAAWLGEWAGAISEHHERFDGTGYPNGRAGHQISQAGRLVAITDAFDVITAARSYKRPMTAQEARQELVRCAGTQFDPHMVRAFLEISLGDLRKAMGSVSWLLQLATLGRAVQGTTLGAAVASAATITAVGLAPSPLAAENTPSIPARPAITATATTNSATPTTTTPVPSVPPTTTTTPPADPTAVAQTTDATFPARATPDTTVPPLPTPLPTTTTVEPPPVTPPASTTPTLPPLTLPAVTLPSLTLPQLPVPPISAPPSSVSLPPITLAVPAAATPPTISLALPPITKSQLVG